MHPGSTACLRGGNSVSTSLFSISWIAPDKTKKPTEHVLGLVSDTVNATHWVYTDSSLFELKVNNETRDIWHFYMTQGDYEKAMKYASVSPSSFLVLISTESSQNPVNRDLVNAAQADTFFSSSQYIQAAQKYALTTRSFEEVTLRFVDAGERDSLRYYLVARLLRTRKTDLTQRMMLATWLVEFFLAKANDLDDLIASESASHDVEDLRAERTLLENDLKDFFETYKVRSPYTHCHMGQYSHRQTLTAKRFTI